jgi:hypothetical protein
LLGEVLTLLQLTSAEVAAQDRAAVLVNADLLTHIVPSACQTD